MTASTLAVSPEALNSARMAVRDLLTQSQAYGKLAPDVQRQLAHDLVNVGSFLAEPGERIPPDQAAPAAQALASLGGYPLLAGNKSQASSTSKGNQPSDIGADDAPAFGQAVRTGVDQAVAMVKGVNFPGFVSGLIQGVFHSIVTSSIEQMEAFAKLVADVSKSLNQFRDENTTPNQGRDHLLEQFPGLFQMQEPGQGDDFGFGEAPSGPRLVLREDIDERQAVERINSSGLALSQPVTKLNDELVETLLVPAARTTIATSRQQLLATMVMMGIQRIVVTEGKIMAKVMFDFQAKDTRRFQRSATKYDYATDAFGNVQKSANVDRTWDRKVEGGSVTRNDQGVVTAETQANRYSTGTYKYDETPIVTLASTSQLRDDSSLQTKASLAGLVEVNFKSDYLPLEKMADPASIAAIQMNAQPGMVKTMAGRPAPAPAQAPAAAAAPATPPTAAPVTAPPATAPAR